MQGQPDSDQQQNTVERPVSEPSKADRPESSGSGNDQNIQSLDTEELKLLTELKARDREVRAHELAHQAVGGQFAGAVSFTFQRGPDGAQYAVGGEVSIDTSPVAEDPQATIDKMRVVRAAALAPAEPSAQDRAVAAQATQLMLQAQAELSAEIGEGNGDGAVRPDARGLTRINLNASETYQSVSGFSQDRQPRSESVLIQATA